MKLVYNYLPIASGLLAAVVLGQEAAYIGDPDCVIEDQSSCIDAAEQQGLIFEAGGGEGGHAWGCFVNEDNKVKWDGKKDKGKVCDGKKCKKKFQVTPKNWENIRLFCSPEVEESPSGAPTDQILPVDDPVGERPSDAPTDEILTVNDPIDENPPEIPNGDLPPLTDPSRTTCFDYTEAFDLEKEKCNWWSLYEKIHEAYNLQAEADWAQKWQCKGGVNQEVMRMTQTTDWNGMVQALEGLCRGALEAAMKEDVQTISWDYLESNPHAIDLEEFFEGGGFMNDEYGNFNQTVDDFESHGGDDRFFYYGEDPRLNDYLPTTERSYMGGKAVAKFYGNEATKSILSAPTLAFESECEAPAVVCCWHRDRQYFDNNGHCSFGYCADSDPGDNTDLCFTESDGEVYAYPEDDTEGDLHCHGFAWSSNEAVEANTIGKWNNLFYVSMYDHNYMRGYADSITDDPLIEGKQPMCGCVEEMNPVARADCTEVIGHTNYTAYQDSETGLFVVTYKPNTFELEFKACGGYKYDEDVSPEDYAAAENPHDLGLQGAHNDLSGFVFQQYLEGKITEEHTNSIEKTIIGYRDPSVNDGDDEREAACEAEFKKRYPNEEYESASSDSDEE